jgi:hypothetical protein
MNHTDGHPDFAAVEELSSADRWWLLLHYAVMAASGHNAQPWRFRIHGDTAELLADRSRSLPVVDPQDRELAIGCGAALLNLRIAIHHFGFTERVTLLPDAADPDLLSRVELVGQRPAEIAEQKLFEAIPARRTNRLPFEPEPVGTEATAAFEAAAAEEGAWLVPLLADSDRKRVAALIADGDRIQAADPALRREMAAWVRGNESQSRDGLRGYSFGHGRFESLIAPLYIRYANWGESQAESDRELASRAPLLAVLGSDFDSPLDWLRTGQALGRILLTAQASGLSASFFNQPVEVPSLRERLRVSIGASGFPQLCIRIGHAKPVLPSPRRKVEDVVIDCSGP